MTQQPNDAQWREIDDALRTDRLIEAIRLYRGATNTELAAAMAVVQARQNSAHQHADAGVPAISTSPPEFVTRYLAGGHCRPGELAGWWRNRGGDCCVLILYQREPLPMFELGVFREYTGNWGHDLNGSIYSLVDVERALAGERPLYGADFAEDGSAIARIRVWIDQAKLGQVLPRGVRLRASRTALYSIDSDPFERNFLHLPQGVMSEPPLDAESDAGTGGVVWARCLVQCDAVMTLIDGLDTLFADLAAERIDATLFAAECVPAFELLLAVVDIAARRRTQLPWWLQAFASASTSSVGLLAPHELRLIARHRDALQSALLAQPGLAGMRADLVVVLDAIVQAAADDRWLVGVEPGT